MLYETDRICLLVLVRRDHESSRASERDVVLRKHGG